MSRYEEDSGKNDLSISNIETLVFGLNITFCKHFSTFKLEKYLPLAISIVIIIFGSKYDYTILNFIPCEASMKWRDHFSFSIIASGILTDSQL